MILLIEMYKHCQFYKRLKCSTENIKYPTQPSIVQSVSQVQTTADVHNVLLVLEHMSEDMTPLLDDPVDDLLIKHLSLFNQTRLEVIHVTCA